MRADLEALENSTSYRFHDREFLHRALTHSSHVHEKVLLDKSDTLVARNPGHREGRLSKVKAHLVSATHLFSVAQKLDLGKYLQLGRGEEMSGGRTKRTLLVDALEALIAAVYLDGGMDAARAFVSQFVIGEGNGDLNETEQN